jgi:hypothetical protein
MKIIAIALIMASSVAFAGTPALEQGQQQQQQATADATNSGVSLTQNNTGADMKTQGADAAAINAAAALEIARIQVGSSSTRDLSGDQKAALDRAAALEIARINSTTTIKNTPSVSGPALTTSNDTCMGSTSGSLNIAGLGIGGGSSWVDGNCKMLKNSRELWNMGMKAASLALMCNDADNKAALEITGFVCPQTAAKNKAITAVVAPSRVATPAEASTGYTGTDPIVRARLELK